MRSDEEKMLAGPSLAEKVVAGIIWILLAAIVAVILFSFFHLYLWGFSWMYKLSVHFHYLP